MAAQIDERARQRALDEYRVVDTLPDVAYNDIVQIASILCDVPMALMSLIDRDSQWFKAGRGMDTPSTHRDIAFCAQAIEAPTVLLEVSDATRAPRFVASPLVTGTLGLCFYAGMPLIDGEDAVRVAPAIPALLALNCWRRRTHPRPCR